MIHRLPRKLLIGIIGLGALTVALTSSATAGAAPPVYRCGPGNYACGYNVVYTGGPSYVYGYTYKDNRFCGDGNVTATPYGYVCANGTPIYNTGYAGYPYYGVPAYVSSSVVQVRSNPVSNPSMAAIPAPAGTRVNTSAKELR